MFTTRWWQPGGSGGIDDAFAQQHGPGIGVEIMVQEGSATPDGTRTRSGRARGVPTRRFTHRSSSSPITRARRFDVHLAGFGGWLSLSPPLLGVIAVACAHAPPQASFVTPPCEPGDTLLVRDVLYFGRNRPDGGTVGDSAWGVFVVEAITPRFPQGFTVLAAVGQWRGRDGGVEQERTAVVTMLHAGDATGRAAVAAIAAEYKHRFGQEAVLRDRAWSCAHL